MHSQRPDPEGDRIEAEVALGYDEDGSYQMGILPLIVPAITLAPMVAKQIQKTRQRNRAIREEASKRGVSPSVVRQEQTAKRKATRQLAEQIRTEAERRGVSPAMIRAERKKALLAARQPQQQDEAQDEEYDEEAETEGIDSRRFRPVHNNRRPWRSVRTS